MESKKAELIKNTLVIALGRILPQTVTFLLIPVYTAYLSPADFGFVDLVAVIAALVIPLATIQLEFAAFRFLIEARSSILETSNIISNALAILLSITSVSVLMYCILGQFIVIPHFFVALLSVLATLFSSFFSQIARGMGQNNKYAQGSILAAITTVALNILFVVYLNMGAKGMLLALSIGGLVNSIFIFFALNLRRYINIKIINKTTIKNLIAYSLPLVPGGISWWVISAVDRIIITLVLGVAANGIFAVAYKFPLIFSSLYSVFGMSWTESAAMHINSKDRDVFFSNTFNASVKLFGSLAVGIVAFVPLAFNMLVASNFHEARLYVPLLIIGSFMNALLGMYTAVYFAKKMTRQILHTAIIAAAVSIALNITLIPLLGLYAAAISMIISFGGMAIYRHYDVKKHVSIKYDSRLFAFLGCTYALSTSLYYANLPITNILNAGLAVCFAVYFNKSVLKQAKTSILSRRRNLTPDQQILEEIVEKKL